MNFESTLELFDEYYRYQDRTNLDFNKDLAMEARRRIKQLGTILHKVSSLEVREKHLNRNVYVNLSERIAILPTPEARTEEIIRTREGISPATQARLARAVLEIFEEIQILTEAFYYFAFRTRQIIRSLPGLGGFECTGARDVRNHLIEHPEKTSRVFTNSFSYGAEHGPMVKGPRFDYQRDVSPDQGLYVNAQEFKDNLEQKLRAKLTEFTKV